jgi:MATE family multidrug resistance protein
MPAAPGLLPEFAPPTASASPKPMTQRRVLSLATPIIGENLLQTLVGAVDTFMVARLGAAAVAGVGTGFEIVFFIISILSAINVGATVLVSQAIGAGDQRRANQLSRQAIVWGLVLAIPVSVGVYLAFVCGAVLRGAGDSRTPLAAAVLANVINIVVAYTLIFGNFGFPALGVAGSAFGAAAGRGFGAAYMLLAMARGKKAISLRGSWGWRPRVTTGRQLFTLGVPAAVEQMLSSGAFMVLLAVVALIGTPALAAQQIAFTALSTAFLPGIAFSITATALVGQSIGARLPSDARKAWDISLRWAIGWLGIGGILVYIFSEQLMRIFSSDPEVVSSGVSALHALSFALPFWAVWFVSSGSLRGSGDTRTPLIVGASTMWLSVLLAWIGVRWFDAGMGWVWTGFVLTSAPASILVWWMFRQRIGEYERGRRDLPEVTAAVHH